MLHTNTTAEENLLCKKYDKAIRIAEQSPAGERESVYRSIIQGIESDILALSGEPYGLWAGSEDSVRKIEELLRVRKDLLNRMFRESIDESERIRFRQLNHQLLDLTKSMGKRVRTMAQATRSIIDKDFDHGLSIEGELSIVCLDASDCLRLEKDSYYASDFPKMLALISNIEHDYNMVQTAYCKVINSISDPGDAPLRLNGEMDDGVSWSDMPCRELFTDTIICYATRQICDSMLFSLPDYLRINNFDIETTATFLHSEDQYRTKNSRIGSAPENEFIDKFLIEAKTRPDDISIMDFLKLRVKDYDLIEKEIVDSISVKEGLSPECFLREVYAAIRRQRDDFLRITGK